MDQQELQNQIALYYSKLPAESQKVFSGMEWLQTLRGISEKYSLTEPQIQTLGTETTLAMLGIVSVAEYEDTVKKELGADPKVAAEILSAVDEQILKKIRPELDEAYKKNIKPPVEEKLDERFDNLSEKTRNAIMESGYYATLFKIGEEFKLNVSQIGTLEAITTNVITGVTHPDKFEVVVKEKMGLTEEKARSLVSVVNENILKKIREKLIGGRVSATPTTLVKLDLPELEMPADEHEVLNKAGIKIIPVKTIVPSRPLEKKIEIKPAPQMETKKIPVVPEKINTETKKEAPTEVHDLLAKKLSNSFQMPKVETKHSLNDAPSHFSPGIKPASSHENQASPSYNIKSDPYREIPD